MSPLPTSQQQRLEAMKQTLDKMRYDLEVLQREVAETLKSFEGFHYECALDPTAKEKSSASLQEPSPANDEQNQRLLTQES